MVDKTRLNLAVVDVKIEMTVHGLYKSTRFSHLKLKTEITNQNASKIRTKNKHEITQG